MDKDWLKRPPFPFKILSRDTQLLALMNASLADGDSTDQRMGGLVMEAGSERNNERPPSTCEYRILIEMKQRHTTKGNQKNFAVVVLRNTSFVLVCY